jgi:hypothetical protein
MKGAIMSKSTRQTSETPGDGRGFQGKKTESAPAYCTADNALSDACRNLVHKAIGQTGAAPRYARASFRVSVDGRVFEYSALLKLVGGAR